MNERLSALVDGELAPEEMRAALMDLSEPASDSTNAWRTYHLISDVLHDGVVLSPRFSHSVLEKLDAEVTVLTPGIARPHRQPKALLSWPVAASVAAGMAGVALVGWLALGPVSEAGRGAPMARLNGGAAAELAAAPGKSDQAQVAPLTESARDYLLAHQRFSPRGSLQGVAPYVRTVSTQALAAETR